MKKILITLTLLISLTISAQPFKKDYNHVIKKVIVDHNSKRVFGEWNQTNLTAHFSGNDKGDIVLDFGSTEERYIKTGKIMDGISNDDFKYRWIEAQSEKGEKVKLQLFIDISVFRINKNDTIYEYQQWQN